MWMKYVVLNGEIEIALNKDQKGGSIYLYIFKFL